MANMTLIDKVTVGSGGAANIEFTGIPQTYTDLQIVVSGRSDTGNVGDYLLLNFNSSTSNLSSRTFGAYGPSSTFSGTESTYFINILPAANATANTFGNNSIYIPNYTSSNYKSGSIEGGFENNSSSSWFLFMTAGLWSNTSAITSVKLDLLDGNFTQYSTAYLYGVTSVTASAKATGGTITSDGAYFYHTFLSSGTFTPASALSADVLVLAGGGGGGGTSGGGGGAGGLIYGTSLALTASTNYGVTVGAGGALTPGSNGANGSNSTFNSTTLIGVGGGGGGTSAVDTNGVNGGCGGAGAGYGGTKLGGSSTQGSSGGTGYGFAGGNGNDGQYRGGGGGGVGQAGYSSTASQPGIGGNGTNLFASWLSATGAGVNGYIGGGGGGGGYYTGNPAIGGLGGGADGSNRTASGTNAPSNTGGGGGGSSDTSNNGSSGGSGLVIVRYAV